VFRIVGQWLKEVHSVTAGEYGYLGEHRPMRPQKDWWSAFRIMWDKMADNVHEVKAYSDQEKDAVKELLHIHKKHFTRNVPSSLLHMDIWHQNILVNKKGEPVALVDWDRALWGDPEIEFAVLDYCGVSGPAFWTGYGSERDLSESGAVRNLFYLLYEVQKYIIICMTRRKDHSQAMSYKAHVASLINRLK
jgi:fructosamine-3-kinase